MANTLSSPVPLEMFQTEAKTFLLTVVDAAGDPVDLSSYSLRFVVFDIHKPPVGVFDVEDGSITRTGTSNEVANVPVSQTDSAVAAADLRWILWDSTNNVALMYGSLLIKPSVKDVA